jgi:hypothetical protein
MLDVRCSTFISFFSDQTGRLRPEAALNPEPLRLQQKLVEAGEFVAQLIFRKFMNNETYAGRATHVI